MDNMEVAIELAAGKYRVVVRRRRSLSKYQGGGGCHEEECRW